MFGEILIGSLVGLVTYMYLHYLDKKKAGQLLKTKVKEQARKNAAEMETEKQTMTWLNFLMKHWYLLVDKKLQVKIKAALQPVLDDINLPAPITGVELLSVTFGESPPYFEYSKASRQLWEDDPDKMNLELILGPRVKSNDCEVHLNVKGIGEITMSNFQFTGDMQVTVLVDKSLPFPCVNQLYFSFKERPDLTFDLNYGLIDIDAFPGMKNKLINMIEEVLSDTLVDPGRFLIEMTEPKMNMMLIKGVRKLKSTVVCIQVSISKNLASKQTRPKERKISFCIVSGNINHSSEIIFVRDSKTLNIWFPISVLQEEIRLTAHIVKLCSNKKVAEITLDPNTLGRNNSAELLASQVKDFMLTVKATASDLPHIPIRQRGTNVIDYSKYFKIPHLSTYDVMQCPSGLVYLHIHRATGIPIKDFKHIGTSDPYCTVSLNGIQLFKTQVMCQNLNPVFNFFEDFLVQNIASTSDLEIKVFDKDRMLKDDYIGNVKINLINVAPKVVNKGFDVLDEEGKQVSLLYLTIIFRPLELHPTSVQVTNSLVNNFESDDFEIL